MRQNLLFLRIHAKDRLTKKTETVSIVGMGYVGLCTAATFASRGINTIGIDIDEDRIGQIQRGKAPLCEPQLDQILSRVVKRKLLKATTAISIPTHTDAIFLAV